MSRPSATPTAVPGPGQRRAGGGEGPLARRFCSTSCRKPIVERLGKGEQLIADRYDDVAVVFSDFVGFTEISARLEVGELVSSLNALFSAFDAACAALGVEKIKTIGDAYMAAAGLPGTNADHVAAAADLALAMQAAVARGRRSLAGPDRAARGPVVAGVIGTTKFVYDLWGDAVNVASRLETSRAGRHHPGLGRRRRGAGRRYELEPRGAIELKGKGSTETFLLVGRRPGVGRNIDRLPWRWLAVNRDNSNQSLTGSTKRHVATRNDDRD